MKYGFYGADQALASAVTHVYPEIATPRDLYRALSGVWCAETCAPRMRADWASSHVTLGQCSVTAFLAQDIFGGRVFGIPLKDGGFHCYNETGGCVFDLTSEQFGDEALRYQDNPEQFREIHFAREEKRLRYELLKKKLLAHLKETASALLTVDVACEEALRVNGASSDVVMIPFSGTASGPLFSGRIISPGVDTQKIRKDGGIRLSARYMLEGTDPEGARCRLFIENQGNWTEGFVPKVVTDSPALAWLESEPLCATIDGTPRGVLIRIFRQRPLPADGDPRG